MSQNIAMSTLVRPGRKLSFEAFDAMPREVRDALNYAAFKYTYRGKIKPHQGPILAAHIKDIDARSVAAAYAKREALDELKELGL